VEKTNTPLRKAGGQEKQVVETSTKEKVLEGSKKRPAPPDRSSARDNGKKYLREKRDKKAVITGEKGLSLGKT